MLKLDLEQDNLPYLITSLQNYAISLRDDNQLALSQRVRESALVLAQAAQDQEQITKLTLFLLGIYTATGQWEDVEKAYATLRENPPHEAYWQAEEVEQFYAQSLLYRG